MGTRLVIARQQAQHIAQLHQAKADTGGRTCAARQIQGDAAPLHGCIQIPQRGKRLGRVDRRHQGLAHLPTGQRLAIGLQVVFNGSARIVGQTGNIGPGRLYPGGHTGRARRVGGKHLAQPQGRGSRIAKGSVDELARQDRLHALVISALSVLCQSSL